MIIHELCINISYICITVLIVPHIYVELIVPHIERKSILLSTLYGSPSKPLRGREIHSIEQSVGDAVLFLWRSLASLLYSLRGVMYRGSGRS